jgi:glutathione S-transferase
MKLIGQYDSPFVRRVAIAMRLQGLEYEHLPWSVFADADRIAAYNPLLRVPTLVLSDGLALGESHDILLYLDEASGHSLWPEGNDALAYALRAAGLATGAADKAVSLFYEELLHPTPSAEWIGRCERQIGAALDRLDALWAEARGSAQQGDDLDHADLAVACAWRFVSEAHAGRFDFARWPRLAAHSERCEVLPLFIEIAQPFTVNR